MEAWDPRLNDNIAWKFFMETYGNAEGRHDEQRAEKPEECGAEMPWNRTATKMPQEWLLRPRQMTTCWPF